MLRIHSVPKEEKQSSLYAISVNGTLATPAFSRISAMPFNTPWPGHQRDLSQTEEGPFISFESDEKVTLNITVSKKIEKAVVRPLSKKVAVEVLSDNTLRFELEKAGGYVLEVNGLHCPLHIFFNPVRDFKAEAEAEKALGRTVYYYGPGVHEVGDVELPSHCTVTVDAGAYVYGNFSAFSGEDIKINGYGVIDGSREIRTSDTLLIPVMKDFDNKYPYFADNKPLFDEFMEKTSCLKGILRFYFCKNVNCEGVILRDSSTFCLVPAICEDVVVDNLKTIGMWRYNSDGIDLFNSKNVEIKNCFLRNFDDVMVIKGIAGWDYRNNEDITIDNCVLWCDWGAACEIGAETNAVEFKNISYKNCDMLYDAAGAMMRIHHHNRSDVHHVSYENMHCEFRCDQMNCAIQSGDNEIYEYVEGSYQPQGIFLVVTDSFLYGRENMKGCIHDVSFKNIHFYYEDGMKLFPEIRIKGLNEHSFISDVTLEDFYVNGQKVDIKNDLKPIVENFAYNINF